MAKDPIKKAGNGTYYFRANLGYHPITGKQIQKYRSGFATKKEAREEYSKLILSSVKELDKKKEDCFFSDIHRRYLSSMVQNPGKGKHVLKPLFHHPEALCILLQNGDGRN